MTYGSITNLEEDELEAPTSLITGGGEQSPAWGKETIEQDQTSRQAAIEVVRAAFGDEVADIVEGDAEVFAQKISKGRGSEQDPWDLVAHAAYLALEEKPKFHSSPMGWLITIAGGFPPSGPTAAAQVAKKNAMAKAEAERERQSATKQAAAKSEEPVPLTLEESIADLKSQIAEITEQATNPVMPASYRAGAARRRDERTRQLEDLQAMLDGDITQADADGNGSGFPSHGAPLIENPQPAPPTAPATQPATAIAKACTPPPAPESFSESPEDESATPSQDEDPHAIAAAAGFDLGDLTEHHLAVLLMLTAAERARLSGLEKPKIRLRQDFVFAFANGVCPLALGEIRLRLGPPKLLPGDVPEDATVEELLWALPLSWSKSLVDRAAATLAADLGADDLDRHSLLLVCEHVRDRIRDPEDVIEAYDDAIDEASPTAAFLEALEVGHVAVA